MSRFSGSFDFYDEIAILGLEYVLNCEVYKNDELLDLNCLEDCIKYYPYGIRCSHTGIEKGYIKLTDRPLFEIDERNNETNIFKDNYLKELTKIVKNKYKKLIKLKKQFSKDKIIDLDITIKDNNEYIVKIIFNKSLSKYIESPVLKQDIYDLIYANFGMVQINNNIFIIKDQ